MSDPDSKYDHLVKEFEEYKEDKERELQSLEEELDILGTLSFLCSILINNCSFFFRTFVSKYKIMVSCKLKLWKALF